MDTDTRAHFITMVSAMKPQRLKKIPHTKKCGQENVSVYRKGVDGPACSPLLCVALAALWPLLFQPSSLTAFAHCAGVSRAPGGAALQGQQPVR